MRPVEHAVVSEQEWLLARKALLVREKQFTHLRDEINAERLASPWVRVTKQYVFDAPEGRKTLADLFDGRSQLLIYHFMSDPAGALAASRVPSSSTTSAVRSHIWKTTT